MTTTTTKPRAKREKKDDDGPSLEERREILMHVAVDGLEWCKDVPDALPYVLQCICLELCRTSITVEDELQPANLVMGALVGGLFGIGKTATDETILKLHQQAERLRYRIVSQIGLPPAGQTLADDIEDHLKRSAKSREVSARIDATLAETRKIMDGMKPVKKPAPRKPKGAS
jgi:hypothetical protein